MLEGSDSTVYFLLKSLLFKLKGITYNDTTFPIIHHLIGAIVTIIAPLYKINVCRIEGKRYKADASIIS